MIPRGGWNCRTIAARCPGIDTGTWPDTPFNPSPTEHLHGSPVWLLSRHPQLVERVTALDNQPRGRLLGIG